MSLRWRLIVLVGVVALLSAGLFTGALLYVARATLGFGDSPKIERGMEIAASAPADSSLAAAGAQARRAYYQMRAVKGLVEQRIALAGVLFGVLTFGLTLGLSMVVLVRLTRPLKELTGAINQAGAGDLTVKVRATPGSEVGRVVEAFNNMTERLRAVQENLRRSERLAAWREVARMLAHEVRNPLTPIRLSVERLQDKAARSSPDLGDVAARSAKTILEEIEALDRIVREFTEFARLPAPVPRPVDVGRLLCGLVDEYRTAWPTVRFDVHASPAVTEWSIDAEQMRRAFANLLKNSVEAVDPSSGAVRVSLTARGEKLSIAFEDNGPGIPADVRQRAFEPYFTTKARGTGLGLAICRNIVAEHGGTIEIDSPDRGARIVVTLQRPTAAGPVTTSQRDVKEPDAY